MSLYLESKQYGARGIQEPQGRSNMTRVVNLRDEDCDVRITRPSPWGNPYYIGVDGTREQVIAKFRAWVKTQPELIERARRELRGKTLGCWCKPFICHGDVWVEIVDG